MFQIPAEIQTILTQAHTAHKVVVLVTGVFDLLHSEHVAFLRKAKAAGDVLLVGLESDVRVRQVKGEGRPVQTQDLRRKNLVSLGLADGVFILPEQFSQRSDHRALIESIRPHILAVSSHTLHQDKKQAIMDLVGGKVVVVHHHNPQVSTTHLLEK